MDLSEIERRVGRLEDIEAIKQLKARCSALVDRDDAQGFADLFTDDGVFAGAFQSLEGREALEGVTFWPFMVHYVGNPIIEVEGDEGYGEWYFLRPYTDHQGQACWAGGRYDDRYVRREGVWIFRKIAITNFFAVPYAEGWSPPDEAAPA